MLRKLITFTAAVVMAASLAVTAFAGAPVAGKVTKVDGEKITVTVEGAMPAWAKKGASVNAAGSSPKVLSVQGNEVTLKFTKSKAAKMAVDSAVTLTEAEAEEMQGC